MSHGDYLEQLTYLIFLKLADEYSKPPYNRDLGIPKGYGWEELHLLKGAPLEDKYKETLEEFPGGQAPDKKAHQDSPDSKNCYSL